MGDFGGGMVPALAGLEDLAATCGFNFVLAGVAQLAGGLVERRGGARRSGDAFVGIARTVAHMDNYSMSTGARHGWVS